MEEQQHAWPGFSPAPASVTMSPEQGFEFSNRAAGAGAYAEADSPLVFMRTPGVALNNDTYPDSSKRFNSWMESTSPYTARKTPPTASMKSMAAGDENTPPVRHAAEGMAGQGSVGSQQHFQAWLQATNSNSWTPRKSPAAGTPPPAPAPSPAATPMSIMRDLQHSAATPPSTQHGHMAGPQHARMAAAAGPAAAAAAAHNEFDTSDEEDDEDAGEASTTIGAAQLAAAADRTAAASRLASLRANSGSNGNSGGSSVLQQREMHTPPRVPAPSPVINSPAALTQQQQQGQLLQAAADRMVQDSLATPMSHLSISRRPGGAAQHKTPAAGTGEAMTPGSMLVDRSLSRGAAALPASPAEKLIGLMMSPGAEGHRRHHQHHNHHQQQQVLTPSRLSAALGGGGSGVQAPPLSPNLQVIGLMMQGEAPAESAGAAAAAGSSGEAPAAAQQQGAGGETRVGPAGGAIEGEARGSRGSTGGDDGSDDGGSSSSGSGSVFESDDEMDLSELQALCGEGVGPDTPLSVILGMMLSPQVAGLTPHLGAEEQQQQHNVAANDDLNPRILFADD